MGILSTMIQRRASVASSDPRNPAYWVKKFFGGGGENKSGVEVNERTAMSAAEVFACIRNIAEDVGKLPLKVYQSDGDSREEVADHPLRNLLDVEPNPEMTAQSMREALTANAILRGNGYAEIEMTNAGQTFALWPIHSSRVTPRRDNAKRLFYNVTQDSGPAVPIDPSRMLHLKGFTTNGVLGEMVLELGAESIGLAIACERFAASFFGNGAVPGGLLSHPHAMGEAAREAFKKEWNEAHQGPGNAHKTALVEEAMTYTRMGASPEESQALEARQFNVEQVARWFRMPPHKIQHLLRATFSNIEEQSQEYVTDTLMTWLVRWEKECKRKLLKNEPTTFLKHNTDALLRGNSAQRAAFYNTMTTIGAFSVNDVRRREDMNPIQGGDRYLVQRNLVPIDRLDETVDAETKAPPAPKVTPKPPPGEADDEEQNSQRMKRLAEEHAKLLADCYRRILHVEGDKVKREAKKPTFATWAKGFYDEHPAYVRGGIGAAVEACAGSAWIILRDEFMPASVKAQVTEMAKRLAARHVAKSQADIAGGVDLALAAWENGRADETGATEAAEIVNLITTLAKEKP